MESNNDNRSERSLDYNLAEEEMERDDDESTDSSSVDSTRTLDIEDEYDAMMERLEGIYGGDLVYLRVQSTDLLLHVLNNIDEFCSALSNADEISHVFKLGLRDWPKVDVTDENVAAWNKLCKTLRNISIIDRLDIHGQNLSGRVMTKIIESLPHVKKIQLHFSLCTSGDHDMQPFLHILSQHQYMEISLHFTGDLPTFAIADEVHEYVSAEHEHHFQRDGIFSQLLRLNRLNWVTFCTVNLSLEACKTFGDILKSNKCPAERLDLTSCTFRDGGGQHVAHAFRDITTANWGLHLTDVFEDEAFCDSLISSLPLNTSITKLKCCGDMSVTTFCNLLKNIGRRNNSLKHVSFNVHHDEELVWSQLSEEEEQELVLAFQQNFSIEDLWIDQNDELIRAICRLNKAGRSYICKDANSKEKCIQVLDKVKDDLDCLYYHLRENPVLFTGDSADGNASGDGKPDGKRKSATCAGWR